nr:hypothetical protein [Nitrosococcus watsonii]
MWQEFSGHIITLFLGIVFHSPLRSDNSCGVTPLAVIKRFKIFKSLLLGFYPGQVTLVVGGFGFEGIKKLSAETFSQQHT